MHVDWHGQVCTREIYDVFQALVLSEYLPFAQEQPSNSIFYDVLIIGIDSLLRLLDVLLVFDRYFGPR